MAFLNDMFSRLGRVARGQANQGVDAVEDATFEATVRQTVADMKTELNNVVRASAMAMSNYNSLDAEYQKYARQSQEWKDRAGQALDAGNEDLAKKAGFLPYEKILVGNINNGERFETYMIFGRAGTDCQGD